MMWLWAWFTGGGWILVAGAVVVLGLVVAAVVVGATARKRDYAGRHLMAEAVEPCPSPDGWRCDGCHDVDGPDGGCSRAVGMFYGSMTLAGEMEARAWLPAPEVAHSGWRVQTAADLAPETLDAWGPSGPSESYEAWLAEGTEAPIDLGYLSLPAELQRELEDPGPGASVCSLAPGPDLGRLAWLDQQLAAHADWARRMRGQVTGWGLEGAAA